MLHGGFEDVRHSPDREEVKRTRVKVRSARGGPRSALDAAISRPRRPMVSLDCAPPPAANFKRVRGRGGAGIARLAAPRYRHY